MNLLVIHPHYSVWFKRGAVLDNLFSSRISSIRKSENKALVSNILNVEYHNIDC